MRLFILAMLCGCSDNPPVPPGDMAMMMACSQPKSQGPSQPCCASFGVDACGANLFCAAFDGRTQATCYPERSRLDMTSCTGDIQCASGKCNLTLQQCMSTPHTSCTNTIGCAPDPAGAPYYCVDQTCTRPSGPGDCAAVCGVDADCQQSHACSQTVHRCLCTSGEANCDKSGCVSGSTCKQQGCPGGVGDGWCCQ